MSDAMDAEFDTVAGWTQEVVSRLGPHYAIPAGCRGSGSPAALDWLIARLALRPGMRLLDVGAGVGGPAAYAAQSGVRPTLAEPMAGACRAAVRLFGLPTVTASATELPFGKGLFDGAWNLGVLCTIPDKESALRELHRVLRPGAGLGLLVFTQAAETLTDPPEGNEFPTDRSLARLVERAGFRIVTTAAASDFPPPSDSWQDRVDRVETELAAAHSGDPRWIASARQSDRMGRLLGDGSLISRLVHAVAC